MHDILISLQPSPSPERRTYDSSFTDFQTFDNQKVNKWENNIQLFDKLYVQELVKKCGI